MAAPTRELTFWSIEVNPKQAPTKVEVEQQQQFTTFYHITNVALDESAPPGLNTLKIQVGDKTCVLATLGKDINQYQHMLDFVLDETALFTNSGKAKLHVCGYQTVSGTVDDDEDDEMDDGEDEDDEDVPMAVPIANGKPAKGVGKAVAAPLDSEEDEDDEDEDFDEDEEGEEEEDDDDEGEEEDEGEDDDDEEGIPQQLNSDDEVLEADDEDDEDDEDDADDEEEDVPQPKKVGKDAPQPQKRPIAATPDAKPAKSQKGQDGIKVPATAPAKVDGAKPGKQQQQQQPQGKAAAAGATAGAAKPGAAAASDTVEAYRDALVKHLKKRGGPASLTELGQAVKRPPTVAKMTVFIKENEKIFAYDSQKQMVSLKK